MSLTPRLVNLAKQYLSSKLHVGFQSATCMLTLASLIYLSITFTTTNLAISLFQYTLCTFLMFDLTVRILAQQKFIEFMHTFSNVFDLMLLCLLMLLLGLRGFGNHIATFDWFINAANVVVLSCILGKGMIGVAYSVCWLLDQKYILLETIDYKAYANKVDATPTTSISPQRQLNQQLSMRNRDDEEGAGSSLGKNDKYQQFVEQEMVEQNQDHLQKQSEIRKQRTMNDGKEIGNRRQANNFIVFNQEFNDAL